MMLHSFTLGKPRILKKVKPINTKQQKPHNIKQQCRGEKVAVNCPEKISPFL